MQTAGHNNAYEYRLRKIGSHLDSGGYHSASILEVDGGLIVRASAPGSRTPELLEIADVDNAHAAQLSPMSNGVPHRLFPDGYKGFLTALGQRLDRSQAAAVSIVEGTDFVTVGGIQPVADGEGVAYEPLDILLLADDIRKLVILPDEPDIAERQPATVGAGQASRGDESLPDAILRRVATAIDSAVRMVSPEQSAVRSRS